VLEGMDPSKGEIGQTCTEPEYINHYLSQVFTAYCQLTFTFIQVGGKVVIDARNS
jgi:hypothetical protein